MTSNELQNALNNGIKQFRIFREQNPERMLQKDCIVEVNDYTTVEPYPYFNFNRFKVRVDIKELEPVLTTPKTIPKVDTTATDTNAHYAGNIQPIEFIQSVLVDNENINPFQGACIKDIIKYTSRFGKKDDKTKEAKKVVDYALWLLLDTINVKVDPRKHNHTEILKALGIQ